MTKKQARPAFSIVFLLFLLLLQLIVWRSESLPIFGTRGGDSKQDDEKNKKGLKNDKKMEKKGDATMTKEEPQAEQEEEDDNQEYTIEMLDAFIDEVTGTGDIVSMIQPNERQTVHRLDFVEKFFASSSSFKAVSNDNNGESNDINQLLKLEIKQRAQNLTSFLVQTRRTLHRHPELMYQEEQTSAILQRILRQWGLEFTTGWSVNQHESRIPGKGGHGIVADIGTGRPPTVLLRADIDALPILEQTEDVDAYKSRNKGKMHACGHDGHQTMLLGAVSILKDMQDSINGTVRVMFQPAEEGGAGAKRMREEGVLQMEPKPQYAFGMHVWPTLPSGTLASRPGPLLAAVDCFEILVAGNGGHAAMPHLTRDPIVAASTIVSNLQTIVARNLSPLENGVVSVTAFQSGSAFNVIPHSAMLRGTIRALSTEALLSLRQRVEDVVTSSAAVYGCNVTTTWMPDFYPPTVNDPDLFEDFSQHVGAIVSPEGYVRHVEPTMGGEDFSFIAESVPSTFFLLGQGSGNKPPTNYGLHHPHFALDESVMPLGVELYVNLALRALHKLGRT